MSKELLPYFFLYGEAAQAADPDFIHIEDLAARSRPSGWQIAPHKHADLSHVILITSGGGTIQYESDFIDFTAPKLLIIPAQSVHGFEWHEESEGMVLTIADLQLLQIFSAHTEFAQLFEKPLCIDLEEADHKAIAASMAEISAELSWIGLGQNAALHACLLMVMVHAARRLQHMQAAGYGSPEYGSQSQRNLVARYRQLLEQRYRFREPVEAYAKELAVSQTLLREACAALGQSPIDMRDQRAILEAQRLLAFSVLSIAGIGAAIGIDDPAYFSRFFSRRCGVSPAHWRRDLKRRKSSE